MQILEDVIVDNPNGIPKWAKENRECGFDGLCYFIQVQMKQTLWQPWT